METVKRTETVRGKTVITFESGWQVWLAAGQEPDFPLTEGTEVDRKEFEQFILLRQYPAALEKAVSMLALRACTRAETERKLAFHHYDPCVIEMVLYKLEKEGLLNDSEFTGQWIQSRMKKYGASRIYQELVRKGIDRDEAREALAACTEDEQTEYAVSLARKKLRSEKTDRDRQALFRRITGMLVRRGYSWETAKTAFEKAAEELTDDE